MIWTPEKEPEPAKVVDMTQLHLLDHWPFSARCRAQYGGGRNHLKLAWWFKWRDRTRAPWRRLFWCPFGSHDESLWVAGDRAWVDCSFCTWTRTPSEAELESMPGMPIIGPDTKIVYPDWE